jgi:LEA14-like dessication related protein
MLALAVVGALGGCATLPNDGTVDITVVNVAAGSATPFESTLVFTLRYQNSMPVPVTITGASHKIYLDGTLAGEALSNTEIPVPQFGDATHEVAAHISNIALGRMVFTAGTQKTLKYEIRSSIYVRRDQRTLHFTQTKSANLDLHGLDNALNGQ